MNKRPTLDQEIKYLEQSIERQANQLMRLRQKRAEHKYTCDTCGGDLELEDITPNREHTKKYRTRCTRCGETVTPE